MESRTILGKEIFDSNDHNLVYKQLLTSPPLLFAKISRELLASGAVTMWHDSSDSSARVLACACDVANDMTDSLIKLRDEISLADKSTFEHFDRIAYLADALLLTRQNSNIEYFDMAQKPVKMDAFSQELREMLGKYAEHFWRNMPEHFFLHVATHLTEPYRIQRLARWVNYRWPKKIDEHDEGSVIPSAYFEKESKNLILKTLLLSDVSWIDKAGIAEILATGGSKFPALKKLTEKQRQHVLLSLQWTANIPRKKSSYKESDKNARPLPSACEEPVYKNLSGINLSDVDLSGLDLKGANLHRASLNMTKFRNANLCYANLTNTSYMYGGPVFDDLPPSGADFNGADLTGAIFQGARVEALDLNYAILRDADFRYTSVCDDSDVYTMRLAEAKDITGVSFANTSFMRSNIFFGLNINNIDTNNCTVETRYFEPGVTLASLFVVENPQQELQGIFEAHPPSFYLIVKLYLAAKNYHETIHNTLTSMLKVDRMYGAKLLSMQLTEMEKAETDRLAKMSSSFMEVLQSGQLELSSILNLRLSSKTIKEAVKQYFAKEPTLLLDYCLDFVSTVKLNEVAEFCQSINVLDEWLKSEQEDDLGCARLFALLMKSRLGDAIDFANILDEEITPFTNCSLSQIEFHRLVYLIETICSDQQLLLPRNFKLKVDGNSWKVLDMVVKNLKHPARIFRLGEFISPDELNLMRQIAPVIPAIINNDVEHALPQHVLNELPAVAILSLLFIDVNWAGHKFLESYLDSMREELRQRYGKELCDILYNSLWTTREYPRGSSSSHQDTYYKNLKGLISHTDYIWHKQNAGANLKEAFISGGMEGDSFRYKCENAWLKNAILIKHKNDDRRNFMGESFKGANLCGAKIIDANMEGADFSNADLRHVTFTNTCTKDAKFYKANMMNMQVMDEVRPVIAQASSVTVQENVADASVVEANLTFTPFATLNARLQEIDDDLQEPAPEVVPRAKQKPLQSVSVFFARLVHKQDEEKLPAADKAKRFG